MDEPRCFAKYVGMRAASEERDEQRTESTSIIDMDAWKHMLDLSSTEDAGASAGALLPLVADCVGVGTMWQQTFSPQPFNVHTTCTLIRNGPCMVVVSVNGPNSKLGVCHFQRSGLLPCTGVTCTIRWLKRTVPNLAEAVKSSEPIL